MSERGERALLYVGGLVATAAGLDTVIRGARSIPGSPEANASIESELRYYGAYYAAFGLATLRMAGRAKAEPAGVRAIAGTVFLAGLGRAWGWKRDGAPHPGQQALLAIELVAPAVLVASRKTRA